MSDKTPLERDIERKELAKKPLIILTLFAFFAISLGALGTYTFKLKQELSTKEQEIVLIKRTYDNEKKELLSKIKRLEREHETLKSDLKSVTDRLNTMFQTKNTSKKVTPVRK